jgi:hypothetical protein
LKAPFFGCFTSPPSSYSDSTLTMKPVNACTQRCMIRMSSWRNTIRSNGPQVTTQLARGRRLSQPLCSGQMLPTSQHLELQSSGQFICYLGIYPNMSDANLTLAPQNMSHTYPLSPMPCKMNLSHSMRSGVPSRRTSLHIVVKLSCMVSGNTCSMMNFSMHTGME